MNLDFLSDNTAPAAPEVIAALAEVNTGHAPSYGADPWTAELTEALAHVFARDVTAFPVASGASANSVTLACIAEPGGVICCHRDGHIHTSEYGGPALYTGATLIPVDGDDGKVCAAALRDALGGIGTIPPGSVLNLTNATEAGTVYTPEETAVLAGIAHGAGMRVHVDGSRIANAIAHLGCAPADVTWRAGVDALSFGATKNGGLAADAIIFFLPVEAEYIWRRRKRGGHVPSKMRFLSAQLLAYLRDDAWLRRAEWANAAARMLERRLRALPRAAIVRPVEANHVFVALPPETVAGLEAAEVRALRWPHFGADVIRLVTNWTTTEEEIARFVALVRDLLPL